VIDRYCYRQSQKKPPRAFRPKSPVRKLDETPLRGIASVGEGGESLQDM
jgi:hypothetical protein